MGQLFNSVEEMEDLTEEQIKKLKKMDREREKEQERQQEQAVMKQEVQQAQAREKSESYKWAGTRGGYGRQAPYQYRVRQPPQQYVDYSGGYMAALPV